MTYLGSSSSRSGAWCQGQNLLACQSRQERWEWLLY
jgi:hypothetical protein